MAKIKFGNIVVDMRGKIAGNVYSRNRGGAYARVRVVPINPNTSFQSAVRAVFTLLSQAWKSITATERTSWAQAVGNFARINNLGDSHNLTPNSLYVSLNKNLADVNLPRIDTAPSPASVESVVVTAATAENVAQTVIILLDAIVPTNTSLKVFVSPTVSAGVNSIGTKLRQLTSFADGAPALLDLTTEYISRFGAVGAAGSKIFFKIVPVNETTGQVGASIEGVMVIIA